MTNKIAELFNDMAVNKRRLNKRMEKRMFVLLICLFIVRKINPGINNPKIPNS